MKIKQEQSIFIKKLSFGLKGLLLFYCFLLVGSISAQVVSITSNDVSGGEVLSGAQNTASFTISRDFNSALPTVVDYTVTGTSVAGTDHDLTSGSVTLTLLTPSSQITTIISIIDDQFVEGIETIVITVDNVVNGSIGLIDEVEIDIIDNEDGIISFDTGNALFVDEAFEGGQNGNFRMICTDLAGTASNFNGTGQTITVSYTISTTAANDATGPGAGATDDYDFSGAYDPVSMLFNFGDGDGFRHVNVVPNDDSIAEDTETITVTLTGTSNPLFTIGTPNTATVSIIDNDCAAGDTAPTLNAARASERCDEATVNMNTFIVGGAGSAPTGSALRWSLIPNPSVAADLIAATVSASGTYYGVYYIGGANGCISPATQVDLVLSESPTAGAGANGAACNNPNDDFGATLIDLDDLLDAGADTGSWAFVSGPQTLNPNVNNRIQFSNKTAGDYIYSYTTTTAVAPCTNDTATFTIAVADCDPCVAGNVAPDQITAIPTTFCGPITSSLDDYADTSGPSSTVLRWALSQLTEPVINSDFIANNSTAENSPLPGTYYGYYFDATNQCVSPSLEITLLSNTIPSITATTEDLRCGIGVVNLTAAASINATINWYSDPTGGSLEAMGANFSPNLTQTTTYYVEATLNGCLSTLSEPRKAVVATVIPQPSAGTIQNNGNASACSIKDNGPNLLDLDDIISGQDVGEWVFTSGPVANFTIPNNNILDFEDAVDGSYVFTYTTTVAQTPCVNAASSITITVNDCDVDTDSDGLFDGPEATLGTLPDNPDTDGDGINDGDEVGNDLDNPIDGDNDGIIDALDSNIIDSDMDGVVDQLDPGNDNPCIPDNSIGLCDTDEDDIADGIEIAEGSDPLDPCSPNIESSACVDPVPVDLEILKEVDNPDALIGEEVTFTITLNNLTDSKAKAIIVGELIENGFEYVQHEVSIGTYDVASGEWSIFEIEPSGSATLTISATILEGADNYSNTAELLSSFPVDSTDDNNQATVEFTFEVPEDVNLEIEKKVSLGIDKEKLNTVTGLINTLENELEVFYFIKVTNKSKEDAVTNIQVLDVFTNEEGVDFEITEVDAPTGSSFDQATGTWQIDGPLEINEEIELSYRVSFKESGMVTNTAVIDRSSPRESLVSDEDKDSSSTAMVTITERNEVEVGILYNMFSPDNDGLNDDLKINLIRVLADGTEEKLDVNDVRYIIQIYNRYGHLVFETPIQSTEQIWDGTWKGKDVPDGTYFYTMDIEIIGEGAKIQKGWIQLIRKKY